MATATKNTNKDKVKDKVAHKINNNRNKEGDADRAGKEDK